MRLLSVEKLIINDEVELQGFVNNNSGNEIKLFFKYPKHFANFIAVAGDAFVPALLIPSMVKGEDLEIKPEISEQLFYNLNNIQEIFLQWHPKVFNKIKISAQLRNKYSKNSFNNAGLFFSLGVDSFYSLHKDINGLNFGHPSVSYLIYMKGLELPLQEYKSNQDKEVIESIFNIADKTKKSVIVGETNIRDYFPLAWGLYYQGAGLASVALSLGAGLSNALIPSTHSYKDIIPWGSSPLVDHLWSTERTTIIHDGAEVNRSEKIAYFLSRDSLAMENLRVCINNKGGNKNCGRCEKCKRTMLSLYICGALNNAKTFSSATLQKFLVSKCRDYNSLCFVEENLQLAEKYGSDKRLIRYMKNQIKKTKAAFIIKNIGLFRVYQLSVMCYLDSCFDFIVNIIRKIIPRPIRRFLKKI